MICSPKYLQLQPCSLQKCDNLLPTLPCSSYAVQQRTARGTGRARGEVEGLESRSLARVKPNAKDPPAGMAAFFAHGVGYCKVPTGPVSYR